MGIIMNKIILPLVLLYGCTGVPHGVTPVSDFDLDRYLGKWYEVARLDHSFELHRKLGGMYMLAAWLNNMPTHWIGKQ